MLSLLDLQIIVTLAYSGQFGFPLTLSEIQQKLVSRQQALRLIKQLDLSALVKLTPTQKKKKTETEQILSAQVQPALKKLITSNIVEYHQTYYCLSSMLKSGKTLQQLVKTRLGKKRAAKALRAETIQLKAMFARLPWVVAVGLTGAVAFKNAEPEADLDMVMLIRPNRLWLTRFIVLTWSLLKGKKRWWWQQGKGQAKDHWCFNVWLEAEELSLPRSQRNFYTAIESVQINWFYDPYDVHPVFYTLNPWIAEYLVNFSNEERSLMDLSFAWLDALESPTPITIFQKIINNSFNFFNQLIFALEKKHLHRKNKIPLRNLRKRRAFLHDAVSHQQFIQGWYRQLLFLKDLQK